MSVRMEHFGFNYLARRKGLLGMNIITVIYLVIFIACIAIAFALVLKVSGRLSSVIGDSLKNFTGLMDNPIVGFVKKIFGFLPF